MLNARNITKLALATLIAGSSLLAAPPSPGGGGGGTTPPPAPVVPAAPSLVRVNMLLDMELGDLPASASQIEAGCDGEFELDSYDCDQCLECIHLVSWQDNSSNETGFVVYRRQQGSLFWSIVAQVPANQRVAFVNATANEGVVYQYSVRARRLSTYSAYSSAVATSDNCFISIPH
jgi:hypothetical protein